MMEGIIFGILTVFIFIGIVATCYYIMLRVLHPKSAGKYIILIPANSGKEDIAGMLYAAHMRIALLGDCCRGRVIAVDLGLDRRERLICEDLCRECNGAYLCEPEDLVELISREDL